MSTNQRIDIAGQRFGELTAIRQVRSTRHGAVWLCRCDCGETKEVEGSSLRRGSVVRCGNRANHSLVPQNTGRVSGACVDCGNETSMSAVALNAGGKNRDPGELICRGCNSSRTILIRRLDKLPSTLHEIRAKKMVRS